MSKKLAATVHIDGTVYKAGTTVDADVAKKITNPKAWGESSASEGAKSEPQSEPQSGSDPQSGSADGGTSDDSKYASMSKAELEAEVAKRNEGRDEADQIAVEGRGNKPDLLAALKADDNK